MGDSAQFKIIYCLSLYQNRHIMEKHLLVLSYEKNFGIRKAISSVNPGELDVIWQPQIKDSLKSYTPNLA